MFLIALRKWAERSFRVWDGETEPQTQSSWCLGWAEVLLAFIPHGKGERDVLPFKVFCAITEVSRSILSLVSMNSIFSSNWIHRNKRNGNLKVAFWEKLQKILSTVESTYSHTWSWKLCFYSELYNVCFSFPQIILDVVHNASILVHSVTLFCPLCLSGELISWVALDHEHQVHHQVSVLVTDQGSPPRNASMVVYVTVTDINDNRPYFPQCLPGKELHIKVCGVEIALRWTCSILSYLSTILWQKAWIYQISHGMTAFFSRRPRNCAYVQKKNLIKK